MNIRFLITAAVAAISIGAFAQKPPAGGPPGPGRGQGMRGGGMRGGMPDELKKQLALTPAQEKKIQAIRDKYMAKMKAAGFTPGKPGQPGQRPDFQKLRPIFEAQRKEMDAVYTPKQQAIIKKWRETHGRGGPGGPGGPGGKPGAGGPPKGAGHKGGG